eukprot:scaffold3067_cov101-Isochrysis_galbana.AAC.1
MYRPPNSPKWDPSDMRISTAAFLAPWGAASGSCRFFALGSSCVKVLMKAATALGPPVSSSLQMAEPTTTPSAMAAT